MEPASSAFYTIPLGRKLNPTHAITLGYLIPKIDIAITTTGWDRLFFCFRVDFIRYWHNPCALCERKQSMVLHGLVMLHENRKEPWYQGSWGQHGAIWGGRQDQGGPHVGPMNFVVWVVKLCLLWRNWRRWKTCIGTPSATITLSGWRPHRPRLFITFN